MDNIFGELEITLFKVMLEHLFPNLWFIPRAMVSIQIIMNQLKTVYKYYFEKLVYVLKQLIFGKLVG